MSRTATITRALLKLLLALAAIFASVQSFRLLLLPAIQAAFHPGEVVTSALRRSGIFLCVLLSYWTYAKFLEKRAATELRLAPMAIAAGALSGAALILIAMLPLYLFGVYEVVAYRGWHGGLFGIASVILIAAFLEEVGYRGLLFGSLEQAFGTTPALWLQALIFSAMHIANHPGAAPSAVVLTVVAGTLIGAFWTYIFIHTRNLWVVTANHAAWNYAIILTGMPLSGIDAWRAAAPIESSYHGPFWLSGGVFGPEDSIVTIALVLACVALQIYWSRSTNAAAPSGAGNGFDRDNAIPEKT